MRKIIPLLILILILARVAYTDCPTPNTGTTEPGGIAAACPSDSPGCLVTNPNVLMFDNMESYSAQTVGPAGSKYSNIMTAGTNPTGKVNAPSKQPAGTWAHVTHPESAQIVSSEPGVNGGTKSFALIPSAGAGLQTGFDTTAAAGGTLNNTVIFVRWYQKWPSNYNINNSNHNGAKISILEPGVAVSPGNIQPIDGTGITDVVCSNEDTTAPADAFTGCAAKNPVDAPCQTFLYFNGRREILGTAVGSPGSGASEHWYTDGHAGASTQFFRNNPNYPDFGLGITQFIPTRNKWYCYEFMMKVNTINPYNAGTSSFTDGHASNGSNLLTSVSAHFTQADVGRGLWNDPRVFEPSTWPTKPNDGQVLIVSVQGDQVTLNGTYRPAGSTTNLAFFVDRENPVRTAGGGRAATYDGEMKFWVDGVLRGHWTNLFLTGNRSKAPHAKNLITDVTVVFDQNKAQTQPSQKWYDNVIIATSYIGPISGAGPTAPQIITSPLNVTFTKGVQSSATVNFSGTTPMTVTSTPVTTLPSGITQSIPTGGTSVTYSGTTQDAVGAYVQTLGASNGTAPPVSGVPYTINVRAGTTNSPPTCSIVNPTEGATFSNAPVNITVLATASDQDTITDPNNKVKNVQFFLDGGLKATVLPDSNAPGEFTTIIAVPSGNHIIKAMATDTQTPGLTSPDVTTDPGRNIVDITVNAAPPSPSPAQIMISP